MELKKYAFNKPVTLKNKDTMHIKYTNESVTVTVVRDKKVIARAKGALCQPS